MKKWGFNNQRSAGVTIKRMAESLNHETWIGGPEMAGHGIPKPTGWLLVEFPFSGLEKKHPFTAYPRVVCTLLLAINEHWENLKVWVWTSGCWLSFCASLRRDGTAMQLPCPSTPGMRQYDHSHLDSAEVAIEWYQMRTKCEQKNPRNRSHPPSITYHHVFLIFHDVPIKQSHFGGFPLPTYHQKNVDRALRSQGAPRSTSGDQFFGLRWFRCRG